MDPISMNSFNTSNLLRISGLASGMDTESMVKQLMKAASIPLERLNQQKQFYQWQQEDLRDINTKLLSLRNNDVFNLRMQGTFMSKTVSSSNSSVATATAGVNALNGIYDIKVSNLASAAYMTSGELTDITNPDLALNQSGKIILNDTTIIIDSSDSLNSIITKINNSTAGVNVTYDKNLNRIFFMSKTTGSAQKIDFSGTDVNGQKILKDYMKMNVTFSTDGLNKDTNFTVGEDASFFLSNDKTELKESTNNFSLLGMNITLNSIGTTTLSVSTDNDKIFNSIKSFVDNYNDVITQINTKLTQKRYYDYQPLTDDQKQAMKDNDIKLWEEKARSGDLSNNNTLMRVYYSLRDIVSSVVPGVSNGSLSAIGITTGLWNEGGKLYIDETKLRNAISDNPQYVSDIFTKTSTTTDSSGKEVIVSQGIAQKLYDNLKIGIDSITREAGSSSFLYDTSFIGDKIKNLNSRIFDMQDYLKNLEKRYYDQFTQLETYLGKMNSQSAWLSQQLGSMTK
ncbi:MAG: flagellar filament capping protein FliD [Thermoanaerobacteraceae bacterium]